MQHTARETKQQLQDETALSCGRDQALSARTTELEWSFRREADKLRGNEEQKGSVYYTMARVTPSDIA